jgi:hypothetical protein
LVFPFRVTIGSSRFESSDGTYRIADIPGGTYDVAFEGPGLAVKRVRTGVRLNGDLRLDLDAIAAGDAVDVESYREMCMGVNPPNSTGTINGGASRRARSGTTFRIIVVRNADMPLPEAHVAAIDEARSFFPVITGGAVNTAALEIIDTEPVPVPQGSIVVRFVNRVTNPGPAGTGAGDRSSGGYISSGRVTLATFARIAEAVFRRRLVRLARHEFCHAIGFDHTRNAKSIVYAIDNAGTPIELQDVADPSPEDIRNGSLKYSRSPGHRLSTLEDRDPIAP